MKIPKKITNLLISQLIVFAFKQLNRLFNRKKKEKTEPQPAEKPEKKDVKPKKTGWQRNYTKRRYKRKMPNEAYRHIGLHIVQ